MGWVSLWECDRASQEVDVRRRAAVVNDILTDGRGTCVLACLSTEKVVRWT